MVSSWRTLTAFLSQTDLCDIDIGYNGCILISSHIEK